MLEFSKYQKIEILYRKIKNIDGFLIKSFKKIKKNPAFNLLKFDNRLSVKI